MLRLERLEDRAVPYAVLSGTTLYVFAEGPGTHRVSVDGPPGGPFAVTEDGQKTLFSGPVTSLYAQGSYRGPNVIQNNTALDCTLVGGPYDDVLFGGSGQNSVVSNWGYDTVYALLGRTSVLSRDGVADRVFTSDGASVVADASDLVARFFAPHRTPGAGFVGAEGGVLYVAPSDNGSFFRLYNGTGGPGTYRAVFNLGDGRGNQLASFTGLRAVAYFGGAGDDSYRNETALDDVAYGAGGDDVLVGGLGSFTLLKGSSGNDTLVGRARSVDLSGNGGLDALFALAAFAGPQKKIFRVDNLDVVLGSGPGDLFLNS